MKRPFYRVLLSATGVTVLVQLLALYRQTLVTSYFGVGRDLDMFWTLYAIANVSAFGMGVIVESAYTALLVEIREKEGVAEFRSRFRRYMAASFLMGLAIVLGFQAIFPILEFFFAAGFSQDEKNFLGELRYWFLLWVFLIIPYYAAIAILKSDWRFSWVFVSELILVLGSTVFIFFGHESIRNVPLAYAAGYAAAILVLVIPIWLASRGYANRVVFPWKEFLRRVSSHYSALQVTTLNSLIERYWMSYIPAGGITALGITQQLVMGISGLLSLRDSYMSPIALEQGRAERLQRLITGITVISLGGAAFVVIAANDIVRVLLMYGKVSETDVELLSKLLSIAVIGLAPSTMAVPIWKMHQLMGRHRAFIYTYFISAVVTALLGGVLIYILKMGAVAIVAVWVTNSILVFGFAFISAKSIDLKFSKQNYMFVIRSICAFVFFALLASFFGDFVQPGMQALIGSSICYSLLVFVFMYRNRLVVQSIVKGRIGR